MKDEINEIVEQIEKRKLMEQQYIEILINLREELKDGCECNLLSADDKKQWLKEIEALEWAFGELGIGGK